VGPGGGCPGENEMIEAWVVKKYSFETYQKKYPKILNLKFSNIFENFKLKYLNF